ncbi:MAG: SIS domain-containing protein [Burkholderiales bacterium]|nr:SIS domain-containing protein [Burkholderiales bacterium]
MLEQSIEQQFIDSADLKYQVGPLLSKPIAAAVQALLSCVTSGGKVLACGNGPAGAVAQAFVAAFVGRFERERPGLGALALSADSTLLTAISGNYDFSAGFARQVSALGQAGDVLLAVSTGGNSPNVVAAIEAAHERDMTVLALTGRGGGQAGRLLRETDIHISVPHERSSRILEVHQLALHCMVEGVDNQLLGEQEAST